MGNLRIRSNVPAPEPVQQQQQRINPGVAEQPTSTHNRTGQRLLNDVLKFDLEKLKEEDKNRVSVQHINEKTNIPVFNAFDDKVLISDRNGERIISNHEEINRVRRENARIYGSHKKGITDNAPVQSSSTASYDDDMSFD